MKQDAFCERMRSWEIRWPTRCGRQGQVKSYCDLRWNVVYHANVNNMPESGGYVVAILLNGIHVCEESSVQGEMLPTMKIQISSAGFRLNLFIHHWIYKVCRTPDVAMVVLCLLQLK